MNDCEKLISYALYNLGYAQSHSDDIIERFKTEIIEEYKNELMDSINEPVDMVYYNKRKLF